MLILTFPWKQKCLLILSWMYVNGITPVQFYFKKIKISLSENLFLNLKSVCSIPIIKTELKNVVKCAHES